MNELPLAGCSPTPLSHYLKALGVFRIVGEQLDPSVRAAWRNDVFIIKTCVQQEELIRFFNQTYEPTPIVAPWNGGSGFFRREGKLNEKDPTTGKKKKTGIRDQETAATRTVAKIQASDLERLIPYREAIALSKSALHQFGFDEAPKESEKLSLLTYIRGNFPERYVVVLDAAFALLNEKAAPPPLLGTGLNDGNLDFSNNFMQRLVEVFELDLPEPDNTTLSRNWLHNSLFGQPVEKLSKSAIGQFNPGATGGANASNGFDSGSLVNPWDFILMMEGSLLFAGAAVRRLEGDSSRSLAYPFCVHHSGVGFPTAALTDEDSSECRGEMWMPLWNRTASLAEIANLFGEGRAEIHCRPARSGVDFVQAVVGLGTARGISEFQRFGFFKRCGKNHFAAPLDRIRTQRNPEAALLSETQGWLDNFRRQATKSKPTPPSSMARALRQIEDATIRFCKQPGPTHAQQLLVTFGAGEKSLAASFRWAKENHLQPLFGLSPRWIEMADDGSTEFRLAASLASLRSRFGKEWLPIRQHLEPIKTGPISCWWREKSHPTVIWHHGGFTDVLNRIIQRRLIIEQGFDPRKIMHFAPIQTDFEDILKFIEGRVDERRLANLLWGMSLIDFGQRVRPLQRSRSDVWPPSMYALLKLCFPWHKCVDEELQIPVIPTIHRRAADGRGVEASQLASRRLKASGFVPAVREIPLQGETVRRIAASLLFPIRPSDLAKLKNLVARRCKHSEDESLMIPTENKP